MAATTITVGDVVKWRGSLHVIAEIQSGNAALCPVLPTRTVRHRADILIEFPDTLRLGLVDGALIRCKPFVFHNACKLTKARSPLPFFAACNARLNAKWMRGALKQAWPSIW